MVSCGSVFRPAKFATTPLARPETTPCREAFGAPRCLLQITQSPEPLRPVKSAHVLKPLGPIDPDERVFAREFLTSAGDFSRVRSGLSGLIPTAKLSDCFASVCVGHAGRPGTEMHMLQSSMPTGCGQHGELTPRNSALSVNLPLCRRFFWKEMHGCEKFSGHWVQLAR